MKEFTLFTLFVIICGTIVVTPAQAQDELTYVAVPPCRIVDTREAGGVIAANDFRNFRVSGTKGELAVQGGGDCLDPKAGTGQKPLAISAYVIAVPASGSGSGVLTAYPSDQQPPPVGAGSTVNFVAGQAIGNTTNITLCDPAGSCPADGEFAILARSTDQHVVIDVQGYFYPMQDGTLYVKSNGEKIGVYVDSYSPRGGPPTKFTVLNNKGYLFMVNINGQLLWPSLLYFERSDCSGPAYMLYGDEPTLTSTGVVFYRIDTHSVAYIPKSAQSSEFFYAANFSGNYTGSCEYNIDGSEYFGLPVLENDPAITGVPSSNYSFIYDPPITLDFQ